MLFTSGPLNKLIWSAYKVLACSVNQVTTRSVWRMFLKLINVNGWSCVDKLYKGKFRDENDNGLCGFFKKDNKETSTMYVLNNGNAMVRYKYPRKEVPFCSPMVRWFNLIYCGGYSMCDEDGKCISGYDNLFQAVLNGLKPIGFSLIKTEEVDRYVKKAQDRNIIVNATKKHDWIEDRYWVGTANQGTIKDNFDLDALVSSYKIMGIEYGIEELFEYGERELSSFLIDFDYAHPSGMVEYALNGLILGYAFESTVALLMGEIK